MGDDTLGTIGASAGAPTKGLLIIHGAGDWEANYWQPIAQQIRQCLGTTTQTFAAVGVYYSDVNATMKTLAPAANATPAMAKFKNDFLNDLLRDQLIGKIATMPQTELMNKLVLAAIPGGTSLASVLNASTSILQLLGSPESLLDTLSRAVLGISANEARQQIENTLKPAQASIGSTIQDVARYLYDPAFAQQIKQKMIAGLKLMQQYPEVVLVSHSLGTVVAFDVLNEWTESTPVISHWFTLGCPLTKVVRLRPGTLNRLKNPNVRYWFNVYDTTDLVAGQLSPSFSTLNGFGIHDIFVNIGDDPVKSHDYFNNATTLQMIADVMR
jgi:hypothetical protein